MPWKVVKPMEQKLLFIAYHLRKVMSFSDLCQRYGISRKTGYKWVDRYHRLGMEGLQDQSRRPRCHPLQTPYVVRKAIVELRKNFPDPPGPKKIRALLRGKYPQWSIPSNTTIYNILRQEELIRPQRRRKRVPAGQQPFAPTRHPNDLWSVDFKGQFKTRDGSWCYPLTVMDHESRYLLACCNQSGTRFKPTRKVFESLFRIYGLPARIRSDNGVPFASNSPGGLSQLAIWWIRLGIYPERIAPGKPQQNGQHERMHRTLKAWAARPPKANPEEQQRAFSTFCQQYNYQRPHESLGQKTPAALYSCSPRAMPEKLPELTYPSHYKVNLVHHSGIIAHQGHRVYVAGLLKGEHVGLEEIDNDLWEIYFGPVRLGRVNMSQVKKAHNDYLRLEV